MWMCQGEGPNRESGGGGGAGQGRWAHPGRGALGLRAGRWEAHTVVIVLGGGGTAVPREPTCHPACPARACPRWGQPPARGTGVSAGHSAPRPGHRGTGASWAQGPPLCPCGVTRRSTGGLMWVRLPIQLPLGGALASHPWRVSWLMNSWPQLPDWPVPSLVPAAGPWRAWPCCDGDTLGRQWPQQGVLPQPFFPPSPSGREGVQGSWRSVGAVLARPVLSPPPTACLQPVPRGRLAQAPTLPTGHPLCAQLWLQ